MYGPGRMGYGGWGMRGARYRRRGSPVVGLMVGVGILVLAASIFHAFPYFLPFIFFVPWLIPFLVLPAIAISARVISGIAEERSRRPLEGRSKERELLEALARRGEISAARAALETSLSVSEADEMLSRLAGEGHIEVRASEGRLAYALWEHDRKELEG